MESVANIFLDPRHGFVLKDDDSYSAQNLLNEQYFDLTPLFCSHTAGFSDNNILDIFKKRSVMPVLGMCGIALIVIGVFSFLLPMFGRQFVLVTLFGLTGIGSIVTALIFIAGGVFLLYVLKWQEQSDKRAELLGSRASATNAHLINHSLSAAKQDGDIFAQKALAT